jgi:hypothetical protein
MFIGFSFLENLGEFRIRGFIVGLYLRNISNENLGIMLKQATNRNRKEKTGVEGTAREFEVDE